MACDVSPVAMFSSVIYWVVKLALSHVKQILVSQTQLLLFGCFLHGGSVLPLVALSLPLQFRCQSSQRAPSLRLLVYIMNRKICIYIIDDILKRYRPGKIASVWHKIRSICCFLVNISSLILPALIFLCTHRAREPLAKR